MSRWTMPLVAILGLLLGAVAMLWVDANRSGGLTFGGRKATERVVHDYLLTHPEIIPQAMQRLQDRERSKAVAATGRTLTEPFGSAWAGNPRADVTLVEYYDYNCGYCRASLPILKQLIARDPKLRIVFKELPILAPSSRAAARTSLLAAAQGKFAAFHDALYAAGPVSDATIRDAAAGAGVDLSQAAGFTAKADAEIARNMAAAGKLEMTGTPSWVVGDQVLAGALPIEELERAIAAARAR